MHKFFLVAKSTSKEIVAIQRAVLKRDMRHGTEKVFVFMSRPSVFNAIFIFWTLFAFFNMHHLYSMINKVDIYFNLNIYEWWVLQNNHLKYLDLASSIFGAHLSFEKQEEKIARFLNLWAIRWYLIPSLCYYISFKNVEWLFMLGFERSYLLCS